MQSRPRRWAPQLKRDSLGGARVTYFLRLITALVTLPAPKPRLLSRPQWPADTAAVLYSLGLYLRSEFRRPIGVELDTVCMAAIDSCVDSAKTWKAGVVSNRQYLDTLLAGLGPTAHSGFAGRPSCDDLRAGPFSLYVLRPLFDSSGATIEIAKTCIRTTAGLHASGFGEGEEFHFRYGLNGWEFVDRVRTWISQMAPPNQRLKLTARGGHSRRNSIVLIVTAAGRSLSAFR